MQPEANLIIYSDKASENWDNILIPNAYVWSGIYSNYLALTNEM